MKYSKFKLLIILLVLMLSGINAQNKKFGLGVVVGEQTGLNAKLWVSNTNAIVFGLGWPVRDGFNGFDYSYDGVSGTFFHFDYLWHSMHAVSSSGQFPLFYGIGARVITGSRYNGSFGIRGILGIAWDPRSTPLEIFIEVVPTLMLVRASGIGIDTGIGARVFF